MNKVLRMMLCIFSLILFSCEEEELLPEFGSISVNINFVGLFPESGDVLLTLNTVFPVAGPPAGFAYINNADLENNVYIHTFTDLPFRTYERILISYWPEGYETAGDNYTTIGDYADIIDLSQENENIDIDIDADFELVP